MDGPFHFRLTAGSGRVVKLPAGLLGTAAQAYVFETDLGAVRWRRECSRVAGRFVIAGLAGTSRQRGGGGRRCGQREDSGGKGDAFLAT